MNMQAPPPVSHARPMPVFFPESFSRRKKTPKRSSRTPCPPVIRRAFTTPHGNNGAFNISFKSEQRATPVVSPLYNNQSPESYFEQCFEVLAKLGEGSFGQVFKVRSKEDGILYAVKKSRQKFHGAVDRSQKLVEVEKHERLPAHPNCVRFYKAWEERSHLYILTELCLMSLTEHADKCGRIPEGRVWIMLLDLVKGLKHLHDNGLCHLDIKPANIFIGLDGFTCKLGDFGLCVSMDSGFKDALEGDARYVAKELLTGQFGPKADIFSLGISLLELACDLDIPMGGETWHFLRDGKLPENFTKDLSGDLVQVLSWMMHPDPTSRPDVNQLLRHPCIRHARLKRPLVRMKATVFPKVARACKWAYTRAWLFLLWIAAIMGLLSPLGKERLSTVTTPEATSLSTTVGPQDVPFVSDVTFSDDEGEEEGSFALPNCSPNRSWMDSVPIHRPQPHPITPIPLDLTEAPPLAIAATGFSSNSSLNSSCENSPVRTSVAFSSSPALPSGLGLISTSSARRFRTPDDHRSFSKSVGIEPRNLMEIFNDTAD